MQYLLVLLNANKTMVSAKKRKVTVVYWSTCKVKYEVSGFRSANIISFVSCVINENPPFTIM